MTPSTGITRLAEGLRSLAVQILDRCGKLLPHQIEGHRNAVIPVHVPPLRCPQQSCRSEMQRESRSARRRLAHLFLELAAELAAQGGGAVAALFGTPTSQVKVMGSPDISIMALNAMYRVGKMPTAYGGR